MMFPFRKRKAAAVANSAILEAAAGKAEIAQRSIKLAMDTLEESIQYKRSVRSAASRVIDQVRLHLDLGKHSS